MTSISWATALVAAALYVRGWRLAAGLALGVAACMKLEALAVIPAFALYEAFEVAWARADGHAIGSTPGARTLSFSLTVTVSGVVTVLLAVWLMDLLVPAYDTGTRITYG